jgi:hypothetical protein
LWKPRKDLSKMIDAELANPDVHQVDSPRHTITVNDLSFRTRLKADLAASRNAKSDRVSSGPNSIAAE